jgi:uncharacterized protein (TIGR02145 family)
MSDIDGNQYNTIIIGDQEWTVENLKVAKYRNGDPISEISGDAEWSVLTSDAYCNMNNDENFSAIYGRLYNWQAVHDNRNIAPAGWHVASFEEWSTLINYLGGEIIAGGKLKAAGTKYWLSPNTGATNETGFTARGGGFRYDFGTYSPDLGTIGAWWSSSESDANYAFAVNLNYWDTPVNGGPILKNYGYSVRCVKDH